MKLSEWVTSTAMVRLVLGLAQGFALHFVIRALEQTTAGDGVPYFLGILLPLIAYLPLIAMLEVERMSVARLNAWLAALAILLAGLTVHDFWRRTGTEIASYGFFDKANTPSPTLMITLVPMLFVANILFSAASQDRRRIASYGRYFEVAWKQGLQLAFAAGFVAALWMVLWLGAALFGILKLDFFRELIKRSWFYWPVSLMAVGAALHLTDVAPGIIAGIRRLALVLLSWLLPLITLIILGFLGALTVTSLDLLWQTKRAAMLLLAAAGWLVILANCAYQQGPPHDGHDGHIPAKPLAWAGVLVGPILLVLVSLAGYAAYLRVAQYGWTADRVLLAATILVAGLYALGYSTAGWWNGQPRRRWEATNVAASFAILVILVALMSPLADPARIAVNSQLARLEKGLVDDKTFDFISLRFDGARYGIEALRHMAATGPEEQAKAAQKSLASKNRYENRSMPAEITEAQVAANLVVAYPPNTALPQGLAKPKLNFLPCFNYADKHCDVVILGKAPGGRTMAAVINSIDKFRSAFLAIEYSPGQWGIYGQYPRLCDSHYQALLRGEFSLLPPVLPDLNFGGRRYHLENQPVPSPACPP
ncbi:MAG: DUF4153 domain-containing protein [Magnetospirillum gryphiswaldense]|nr:DUF4153 domain-containing protein [Magnetospirillum gryphiswaldense]